MPPGAEAPGGTVDVPARLRAYYTRYYRDALGIPGWAEHVGFRLADHAYESQRLARLEAALGAPVRGRRLLNVGCGTGGFSVVAAAAGARVWGMDVEPDAVAIARARIGADRVAVAAAEALPFPSGAFDVVYCYSTLEHVADARRVLAEMVRVLAREGRLYLHTPSRWACFESHYKMAWVPGLPQALGRQYLAWRGRPTAFLATLRLLSARRCRRWLEAAGARVIRELDGHVDRPVGGPAWPAIRLYYRALGIRPYVELVAEPRA